MIEAVVNTLKEVGEYDNTLIWFSGDNGGAPKNGGYNYPMRGSKGSLFEGGIRQLSWVWSSSSSGLIPSSVRGTTYHSPLHLVDYLPTFLSIATGGHWNNPDKMQLDGVDVWSSIISGSPSPRAVNGYETVLNVIDQTGGIRIGEYVLLLGQNADGWYPQPDMVTGERKVHNNATHVAKYLKYGASTAYLFNVVEDPYQFNDISGENEELVSDMTAKLLVYAGQAMDYNTDTTKEDAASTVAATTGYWSPWLQTLDPSDGEAVPTAEK